MGRRGLFGRARGPLMGALIALAAAVAGPGLTLAATTATPPNLPPVAIETATGQFFADAADPDEGFAVRNYLDGPRFRDAFNRFGGAPILGPPISRPWIDQGGFVFQLTQRVQMQWSPLDGRVRIANLFETLSSHNLDAALAARHIPLPESDTADSFAEAKRIRLAWLTDPVIAESFANNPVDPGNIEASLELHGLPMSRPQRVGPFVVQRFQRTAIQRWLEQVDGGEPVGAVVLVNAGGLYKELILAGSVAAQAHAIDDTALVDLRADPAQLVTAGTAGTTARAYNVQAPELAEALRMLEQLPRHTAALDMASTLDARFRFRRLGPRTIGRFSAPLALAINSELRREAPDVLATVLAHELVHLADFQAGRLSESTRAACVDAEVRAITVEALTWQDLVGADGQQPARTLLERVENQRLRAVQTGPDAVRELVNQVYERAC